ncbi:unnamed protein product [Gemmata massiliana]|uniref:Uncharacterized protein n=1 Tax=Gemmata massiliana TaxID=1210884 RepID=A0A6P2DAA3_9BACT|nr:hypothetical protein [Gemmata massiliana]VTR97863.1 unnamed protein product [Gemmata massiliana]
MSSTKRTGRYEATGTDGKDYVIIEETTFPDASLSVNSSQIEGIKTYKTDAGDSVNRITQGIYEIADKGVTLSAKGSSELP